MPLDERENVVSGIGESLSFGHPHQQQQRTSQGVGKVGKLAAGSTVGRHRLLVGEAALTCDLTRPYQTVAENDPFKELPVNTAYSRTSNRSLELLLEQVTQNSWFVLDARLLPDTRLVLTLIACRIR